MRDDFRRLAHAGLTFNAPLSEERANALVAALPISPGHHVLDLGCGWGELLLRILAAHPGDDGHRRRHRQGGARPWRPGGGATRPARAGRVRRGARRDVRRRRRHRRLRRLSHAFGGTGDALDWLRQSVDARRPGALRRRLLGGRAVGRGARDDRRAAPARGAPRGRGGGGLPDRARRGLRPAPSGTRSSRAGGRASRRRPTRRRWRSRPSAAASTRTATARRSASTGSCSRRV